MSDFAKVLPFSGDDSVLDNPNLEVADPEMLDPEVTDPEVAASMEEAFIAIANILGESREDVEAAIRLNLRKNFSLVGYSLDETFDWRVKPIGTDTHEISFMHLTERARRRVLYLFTEGEIDVADLLAKGCSKLEGFRSDVRKKMETPSSIAQSRVGKFRL